MKWSELQEWAERNGMAAVWGGDGLGFVGAWLEDDRGRTMLITRDHDGVDAAQSALCRAVAKIREAR